MKAEGKEDLENLGKPAPSNPSGQAVSASGSPSSVELLRDVPLNVTAELGRTKMMVKDILKLNVGSVIELQKLAGEPIDVLVNGKRIACGEVVSIDDNFAVRITEIFGK